MAPHLNAVAQRMPLSSLSIGCTLHPLVYTMYCGRWLSIAVLQSIAIWKFQTCKFNNLGCSILLQKRRFNAKNDFFSFVNPIAPYHKAAAHFFFFVACVCLMHWMLSNNNETDELTNIAKCSIDLDSIDLFFAATWIVHRLVFSHPEYTWALRMTLPFDNRNRLISTNWIV